MCSELVTGYDDFGKVIFLQSNCIHARRAGDCAIEVTCAACAEDPAAGRQNDNRPGRFDAVVRSLLDFPPDGSGVYPPR